MTCSCNIIHEEAVEKARASRCEEGVLFSMAELFKVLGDPTRLRIIEALIKADLCVCDVATVMHMSKPAVAHHLKILRQTRLVKCSKAGKIVTYSLCDEHVGALFEICRKHGEE